MSRIKFLPLTFAIALALAGVIIVICLAGQPSPARASPANRFVTTTGNDNSNICVNPANPCRTIQHAVDAADPGDTIRVASGVYTGVQTRAVPPGYLEPPGSGVIAQVVYITKSLSIRGGYSTDFTEPPRPQVYPTTLDAGRAGRSMVIAGKANLTVEGVRLIHGDAAGLGGGMWGASGGGGGLYSINATLTLSNSQIFNNYAGDGGGIFLHGGSATLSGNVVYSNTVQYSGGGVLLYISNARLDDNILYNNQATGTYGSGGGVFVHMGLAALDGNRFYSNIVQSNGGGIFVNNSHHITLANNTILSNTASTGYGGGIDIRQSDHAMLSGNTVTANQAHLRGGGMYVSQGYDTLIGNTLRSNTAESGGGVYLVGRAVTMTANTVLSNTAEMGGGLYLDYNDSTLKRNTISFNRATLTNGGGGGVFLADSDPILNGNIITSNFGDLGGGLGLYRSSPVIINTVVADNTAGKYGGGLILVTESNPRLIHTTIARNRGGDGSGIAVMYGTLCDCTIEMTNTILVSHTLGITVSESNTAILVATLWDGNTTDWGGAGVIITGTHNVWGNPRFAADGYHILAGSAAIDQGVRTSVTTDIDGDRRDANPDLGADELSTRKWIFLPLMRKYGP